MDQGHYLKHLRGLRSRLADATAATVRALEAVGCAVARPDDGSFYVWAEVPAHVVSAESVAAAAQSGVFIAPSSIFAADGPCEPAMRVNVAHGTHPAFLEWLGRQMAAGRNVAR